MQARTVARDLQIRLFGNLVNHIESESAYALIHPPEDHIINFPAQLRVLPVQIRLLYGKLVKIILLHFRHPLPCRAAEARAHIVRRRSLLAVAPYVIIMVRILAALLRFQKPAMFIRRMIQHQIHNDADVPLLCLRNQAFHIVQASEHRVNVLIVGNIISVVVLRGFAHRGKPDRINAQIRQVIQPPDNSLQIPDSIAVTVLEAAGIDLVNDRILPPFVSLCHTLYLHIRF